MSCSKIFSGDLPELMNDIIKYLQNDFSTLHSCILVNRLWCRLAIPLLWENPFSIPTENYNFIEIYLNNLSNDLKSELNEYKINDNLLPSNTLFNYPIFLEYLNTWKFISSIGKWFETLNPKNRYYLRDSDKHSMFGFKKLICVLLFKLFIKNEVNLHIFEIEVTDFNIFNFYLDDILELILQNPNFIHNIKNLKLYIMVNSSIYNVKIKSIKNRISEMIPNSHQILKKIVLVLDLIEDMRQKLNYLTIDIHYITEPNSIILRNLGQKLPLKLEYLCLELNIYTNDFEIFLKNSQYTFINKLVIKNTSGDHDNMLSCIKENIMKKKRVKYLAIMDAVFDEYNTISENIDLFSLENEVKEFEFYNIIVREYIDLKFNLTDISFEKI
ncbi:unnamed protein product [Rhizophagus irregularis]|nr:unnamed protein product [Rhizophagus irregularis]